MGFGLGSIGKIAGGAIGSIFGGSAGGMLGSAIGGMYDDNQLNKQYMHNQKLAWNMQNEYNNPVQQMARLRAAGLNPMLVYSSGNVTGNSSSDLNFSGAINNSAGDMFSRGLSDIYNNSVKQDLLQQRIAASQNLENNELDLQIKQAQLEYYQIRNDNLKNSVSNPVNVVKPMSVSERKYIDKRVKEYNNSVNPTDLRDVKGSYNLATSIVENAVYYPLLSLLDLGLNARAARSSGMFNTSKKRFNAYEDRYRNH